MTARVEPPKRKPKIFILGGGMAGVTAAYHLSGSEKLMSDFDIELYQQGWRLGGKGASGRTDGDHRILEHGLHVWFGYYENAFRMLRDCHDELNRMEDPDCPRWSGTMHSIEEAFRPISSIGIVEDETPGWRPWIATFPEDDLSPWDRDLATEPPVWDVKWCLTTLLTRSASLIAALVRSAADEAFLRETSLEDVGTPGALEELLVGLGQRWDQGQGGFDEPAEILAVLVSRAVETVANGAEGEYFELVQDVLASAGRLLDAVRLRLDQQFVVGRAVVRRLWSLADVLTAILRGLMYHRVSREEDFDALDEFELRDWLKLHGALAESTTSSLIRTVAYDLPFAYDAGDPDRAACGAGTALRTLFRAFFTYRGAIMWKMNSGMGDVVFAPLYELLVKRGVSFKFFRQITDVAVDTKRVTGIGFRWQVDEPDAVDPVDRLVEVTVRSGGWMPPGILQCWPSVPKERSDDRRVEEDPERFEAWWGAPSGTPDRIPVDDDDLVVFAMPVSMIPHVAKTLTAKSPVWRGAADHVKTTATQAMQIWSDRSAEALGWFPDAVVGGYDAPYDTFSDMPELRFQEAGAAETVLYLCAVLPDQPLGAEPVPGKEEEWVQQRNDDVRRRSQEFLDRRVGGLWPGAVDPATGAVDARLTVHHWARGNFQPSDRYVLSVPGSVRYRIDPGDTGYNNLFVAGDWTRCLINAGCVEAATISGMLAAEAIFLRKYQAPPMTIIGRPPRKETKR